MSKEFRWLIRQALPFRDLYLLQVSSVLFVSVLSLVDPLILKWLIDEVLAWRKKEVLPFVAGAFFSLFLFRFAFASMSRFLDAYTSERLTFDIRRRLLQHLQKLSPEFYLDRSRGELLHRLERDVEQISTLGGQTLASLLRITVMTLLSAAIMLMLDWQLTLLVLPLVPAMAFLRHFRQGPLKKASERVQKAVGERFGFFESQLANMVQVQLLNRQAGERRSLARLGRRALDAVVQRRFAELALAFLSQVTLTAAGAAVLGFGGYRVLQGALTVGGLVAFYSYLVRIFEPIEVFVRLYSEILRATVSIRRVIDLFDCRPAVVEPPNPLPLGATAPTVSLHNVRFAYGDGQPVLDGLDLEIAAGEKVALVGTSGGGKSTIGRLLTRQYDPTSGVVSIGGVQVNRVNLRELRTRVAIVPQDPILFDASLRDNLLYAKRDAGDLLIRQTLTIAQLETTVNELRDGWHTNVGQRGERLSGGQRQRVAIARALIQGSPLLILDEATSALDGFTEHRLLHDLRAAVAERTVLIIAHRISAMLWADRVVLVDRGKVLDQGPHQDLYRRCENYRGLVKEQRLPETANSEAVEGQAPSKLPDEIIAV